MRIAVAYKDGEIFGHFGHFEMFAIYDYENADVDKCTKRLVETAGREGHKAMSDLMREEKVDAVIAGNMGGEAKALLLSYGIVPVVGYCGNADDAADLLLTGRLPIIDPGAGMGFGGCSGSCGSCGGCGGDEGCGCGDGEDGDCGCGCGGCN